MRWRDVIFGALVALSVTILGGIVVYYLTREKPIPSSKEQLVYQVEKPTIFETETTKRSFLTIRGGNIGNKSAIDVRLVVLFEDGLKVLDRKITLSSEPVGTFEDRSDKPHRVDLFVPMLVPGEIITVSMMVDGVVKSPPNVGMRSSGSSGETGTFVREVPQEPTKNQVLRSLLSILVPLAGLAQAFLAALLFWRFRHRIRRFIPTLRSVNDTAFLYIHKGLVKEAEELLAHEIMTRGADSITLANYGLALGLSGDIEAAEKRLDAAEWWARLKHEQAVVAFNRGVLALSKNDFAHGREYLVKAFSLSQRETTRYCNLSLFIQKAIELNPDIRVLVEGEGRLPATAGGT